MHSLNSINNAVGREKETNYYSRSEWANMTRNCQKEGYARWKLMWEGFRDPIKKNINNPSPLEMG